MPTDKIQPSDIEMNWYPTNILNNPNDVATQLQASGAVVDSSTGSPQPNSLPIQSDNSLIKEVGGGAVLLLSSLRSGNFATGKSGWLLDSSGAVEFGSGKFRGDITGASGTFTGTVTVHSLDIPDAVTANSFHVDANGNAWLGAALLSGAIISLANTGIVTVGNGTPNFVIDGVNKRIRTSTYSAGLQGFNLDGATGDAEFNNIQARGEFRSQVLSYGSVHTEAGSRIMSKSAGTLKSDFTSVTSPTTFNVDVNDPPTGHTQLFSASDILRLKDGSGNDNWLTVSSVSDQTTFFRYVCVKQNGSNATFRAGAAIIDYGQSGQSLIYETVDDTNAPFYSIRTHAGSPWSTTTERLRLGNLNGFGSFVSATYGIGIGDTTTNNFLTYDTASGNLIVNNSTISNQDIFGDGSDGDVTISGNTTLSSDMFYNNLTINTGITLTTGGYRIFVKGTLTTNGTGKIDYSGANGGNGGNAGNYLTPGAAGATGGSLADGSIKGGIDGTVGVVGVAGVQTTSGTHTTGNNGTNNPNSGSGQAKSLATADGISGVAGGNSGKAGSNFLGDPPDSPGKTGGTAAGGGVRTGTIYNKVHNIQSAYRLYDDNGTAFFTTAPSNGGSGSGASGTTCCGSAGGNTATSGATGGSGATGSQGGIVFVAARIILNNGTISANGGNGGNGGTTGVSSTVNVGNYENAAGGSGGSAGGDGGNGGILILIYSKLTNNGTISANGGTGGTSSAGQVGIAVWGGTGTGARTSNGVTPPNGTNGNAGQIIQFQV